MARKGRTRLDSGYSVLPKEDLYLQNPGIGRYLIRFHGMYFHSIVGLLLFVYGSRSSVHYRESLLYQYIIASVSHTGSLGPSFRASTDRVSPLGQLHLPVCHRNRV